MEYKDYMPGKVVYVWDGQVGIQVLQEDVCVVVVESSIILKMNRPLRAGLDRTRMTGKVKVWI